MGKKLSVAAIKNGTVIDHIQAGQALRILRLLGLEKHRSRVTLGLNLPSPSMDLKDIIKIEEREITSEEAHQVAVFAPSATIAIIRNFEVVQKYPVKLQPFLKNLLSCPNPSCITNHEPMGTDFVVDQTAHKVKLSCKYCSREFTHEMY